MTKLTAFVACFCLFTITTDAFAAEISVEMIEGEEFVIISLTGEIAAGDEDTFRRMSIEHEKAIVLLDSPGGALQPALKIGRMVRISEYPTLVAEGKLCASSCALIWLSGSPRFLSPVGKVGFHASYYEENGKLIETGVGNAMVGHYLSQLNLPERAVVFATSASPQSITWLDASKRTSSGIDFQDFGDDADEPKEGVWPIRGSLDSLFRFSDPATCEMTDAMLSVFRGLVQMDETTWEATQGKAVQLPGASLPSVRRQHLWHKIEVVI